MTLKELALKLREIFVFDVLTCDGYEEERVINLFRLCREDRSLPVFKDGEWMSYFGDAELVLEIHAYPDTLCDPLDLSEYEFERYNPLRYDHTDYSKCIIVL